MTDAYEAILARCQVRDLTPNCLSALHEELQDVRQALSQAVMALAQLREVEQFALQRTSSSIRVDQRLLQSTQTIQLQLGSAMAQIGRPGQDLAKQETQHQSIMTEEPVIATETRIKQEPLVQLHVQEQSLEPAEPMAPQEAMHPQVQPQAAPGSAPSQKITATPPAPVLVKQETPQPSAVKSESSEMLATIVRNNRFWATSAFERELNAVPEEIDGGNCFSPEQCLSLAREIFAFPPHARDIGRLKELLNNLVVPLVAKQRLSESPCTVLAEAVRMTVALVVSFHYDNKVSHSFQEFQAAVARAARSNYQLKPLIAAPAARLNAYLNGSRPLNMPTQTQKSRKAQICGPLKHCVAMTNTDLFKGIGKFHSICISVKQLDSNDIHELAAPLTDVAGALIDALARQTLATKIANSVVHLQIYIDIVVTKHQILQAAFSKFETQLDNLVDVATAYLQMQQTEGRVSVFVRCLFFTREIQALPLYTQSDQIAGHITQLHTPLAVARDQKNSRYKHAVTMDDLHALQEAIGITIDIAMRRYPTSETRAIYARLATNMKRTAASNHDFEQLTREHRRRFEEYLAPPRQRTQYYGDNSGSYHRTSYSDGYYGRPDSARWSEPRYYRA